MQMNYNGANADQRNRMLRTGLMSLCKNPTECMDSIAFKICRPNRSVVLNENAPRGCARRNSAKFLPCNCITT